MSYFKKFISGLLVLAAIGFLPKYSFAGTFNIIVNAGSVNLQGDYDKRWSSFDKMGTVDENAFVLRAAFEAEIFKNFFMGAGFSSFGKMKYSSPSSYYAWKKDEDKINLVSEYIKINLIDVPVISDTERFQLYAMAGLGQFFWNKNITYYDKGKSKFYDDSAYANMPGYSLAAGINFVLSDVLMLGTEFRYDSTFGDFDEKGKHFSKIKTTSYQSRSFGVNVGLRFGGNSASYENKNWDTSSQNSFDSQSVISYAEQSDNKGWAPLDDAPAAAESSQKISENTSEDLASDADESPVAAVKKSSSEAMSEISPAAVDYNPEYTELDKDEYLSLMDKIWDQEPVDGKIGIPAMGVLFQI
ncbi:MAG: hypothetical protein J5706_05300, partial [Elusimicrobiales bacterium]|nr:hypothetical protein [Elusimicrobiales bacterium]